MNVGIDIGTGWIVAAKRDENKEIKINAIRDAFLPLEISEFTKNMLTSLNTSYVEYGGKFNVIGEQALELSNVQNSELKRPLKSGIISPNEIDALPIIQEILQSLLGEGTGKVYFSVPAEPVDIKEDIIYHEGIFKSLIEKLGYRAKSINEGHCVALSSLSEDNYTGCALTFGCGLVNSCITYMSVNSLAFSVGRGGDWIDQNSGRAIGVSPSRMTIIKERGVDLLNPRGREQRAISEYYKHLIDYVLKTLKLEFESAEKMPLFKDPIPVILAGGTSLAGNFINIFKERLKEIKLPFEISEVRLTKDPLNMTVLGALAACEADEGVENA